MFWQSIMNSTNPADFEAYLAQFPNGVFPNVAYASSGGAEGLTYMLLKVNVGLYPCRSSRGPGRP